MSNPRTGRPPEIEALWDALTPLQRAFVREYLISRNGSESLRKAGSKSRHTDVDAAKLLVKPSIRAVIDAEEKLLQEKFEITQDRIIEEMAAVGFGRITDVLEWDDQGRVRLIAKDQMSERGHAFIDSIKIERGFEKVKDKNGNEKLEEYVKDLKVSTLGKEKHKHLESLGKHLGMWKDGRSGDQNANRKEVIGRLQKFFAKRNQESGGGES